MKNYIIFAMLKSKKFWYTIGAIVVPVIARSLGLDEAEVNKVFIAIVTLIVGQGIADSNK
jgi:hypothetical protein|tara:strand:+ start:398 stop:577 length:180 start_codon:yes stop_codon:yes gene_type:complete